MYNNPYYTQNQRFQPIDAVNPQFIQPITQIPQPNNINYLLGKSVDSIDVVKAMDIPLDGTVSYFPLSDGTAIVTKQLQTDGTSKTIIYKPIEDNAKDTPQFATMEEVKKEINKIDLSDLEDIREELSQIKKEIKIMKKNKEQ